MITVRFVHANGSNATEVSGEEGDCLLGLAQAAGLPLEGTCEGQMACSTCHIIVAPDSFAALPAASAAEEDMLDLAAGAVRTSRLACQIHLRDCPDGLTVHIPQESCNMQGV